VTFTLPRPMRFTVEDAEAAFDAWGANCGPTAIAAIMGLTLDELRPHLGDFESKRYTNPTLIWAILDSLGVRWTLSRELNGALTRTWPKYGLARVQWEGRWTRPGVPPRAAYRHTHWVGAITIPEPLPANVKEPTGIFDVNAMGNGSGWSAVTDWSEVIVPWILKEAVPGADGHWHLTHVVEVTL
jgi:hypothetical protein